MSEFIKCPRDTLLQHEGLIHQRIYTNANPLVRWIFWKRLATLLKFSREVERRRVLDFGCGEGAFLPSLCRNFKDVVAVDVDVAAAGQVSVATPADESCALGRHVENAEIVLVVHGLSPITLSRVSILACASW